MKQFVVAVSLQKLIKYIKVSQENLTSYIFQ